MDDIFSGVERVMAALCEPLGDCAPRCRRLVADYKDSTGSLLHSMAGGARSGDKVWNIQTEIDPDEDPFDTPFPSDISKVVK